MSCLLRICVRLYLWLRKLVLVEEGERQLESSDKEGHLGFVIALRPNQSLKLTEIAVDDFAARQYAGDQMINRYVRAINYMELAVRRRSLAPVR